MIGPALSFVKDVTQARTVQANAARGGCYQGQTHRHEGFLVTIEEAEAEITADKCSADVLLRRGRQ